MVFCLHPHRRLEHFAMSLQPGTDACDLTGTLKEQWPEAGHAAIGCFTDTIIDSSA
jgi:hypothetical protein